MDYLQILNELGIEYIWVSTKAKCGAYIEDLNLIYLSDNLSGIELENFIIHETWHAMSRDFLTKLSAPQLKMVQESKANRFMIRKRCIAWLHEGYYDKPEYININDFLDYYQLSRNFYEIAEQEFRELLAG